MSGERTLVMVDTSDHIESGTSRTEAHAAAAAEQVDQFRGRTPLIHYALIYATGFAES